MPKVRSAPSEWHVYWNAVSGYVRAHHVQCPSARLRRADGDTDGWLGPYSSEAAAWDVAHRQANELNVPVRACMRCQWRR
jgi:hypothetical protein